MRRILRDGIALVISRSPSLPLGAQRAAGDHVADRAGASDATLPHHEAEIL